MKVHQCDNCRSVIKEAELVVIGRHIYHDIVELCSVCAEPIVVSVSEAKLSLDLKEKLNMLPGAQED